MQALAVTLLSQLRNLGGEARLNWLQDGLLKSKKATRGTVRGAINELLQAGEIVRGRRGTYKLRDMVAVVDTSPDAATPPMTKNGRGDAVRRQILEAVDELGGEADISTIRKTISDRGYPPPSGGPHFTKLVRMGRLERSDHGRYRLPGIAKTVEPSISTVAVMPIVLPSDPAPVPHDETTEESTDVRLTTREYEAFSVMFDNVVQTAGDSGVLEGAEEVASPFFSATFETREFILRLEKLGLMQRSGPSTHAVNMAKWVNLCAAIRVVVSLSVQEIDARLREAINRLSAEQVACGEERQRLLDQLRALDARVSSFAVEIGEIQSRRKALGDAIIGSAKVFSETGTDRAGSNGAAH